MSVRTIIVDDEPLARRRLKRLLDGHHDIEIVGEAETGDEAVAAVLEHRPDLVFADVRMPGSDGLQAVRTLQSKLPDEVRPLVVFTTAYEEHAVEAFEVEGIDYLVKPIDRKQLDRALRRVRRSIWQRDRQRTGRARGAAGQSQPSPTPDDDEGIGYLAAHRAGKILRVVLEEIASIEVEDTICWAHTREGRLRLRQGLGELEKRLPSPPFFRVSRSAIVNLDWIDHLAPMFSGTYSAFLRAPVEREVHISRRRARQLRQIMGW